MSGRSFFWDGRFFYRFETCPACEHWQNKRQSSYTLGTALRYRGRPAWQACCCITDSPLCASRYSLSPQGTSPLFKENAVEVDKKRLHWLARVHGMGHARGLLCACKPVPCVFPYACQKRSPHGPIWAAYGLYTGYARVPSKGRQLTSSIRSLIAP